MKLRRRGIESKGIYIEGRYASSPQPVMLVLTDSGELLLCAHTSPPLNPNEWTKKQWKYWDEGQCSKDRYEIDGKALYRVINNLMNEGKLNVKET